MTGMLIVPGILVKLKAWRRNYVWDLFNFTDEGCFSSCHFKLLIRDDDYLFLITLRKGLLEPVSF